MTNFAKNDTPLTLKQKLFCDNYIILGSPQKAALAAGYSPRTAGSQGSQLLMIPKIKQYINERKQEVFRADIASAEEVMAYFSRVMRGEERDAFDLDVSIAERSKAASELAKRTIDIENRAAGKEDIGININLNWKRG